MEPFASRERSADPNTSVHAHDPSRSWAFYGVGNRCERHMPTTSPVQGHAERSGSWDRPRPAEPHPSSLRDEELPPVPVQATDLTAPERHDPESLGSASLTPFRLTACSSEVVCHGLREIPQRLLLDHHAPGSQPLMLGTCLSQLPAVLGKTRHAPASRPPPRLLLDGKVPYEPRMAAMVSQHLFLRWRR
jgi:hypothetical protein